LDEHSIGSLGGHAGKRRAEVVGAPDVGTREELDRRRTRRGLEGSDHAFLAALRGGPGRIIQYGEPGEAG
jgi:hypothetical protein